MLRLILVRHGQTAWNAQNRIMGRTDVPLNEKGQQQALVITRALCDQQIDHIFCSPQLRAMETVQPLSQIKKMPIQVDERLSELRFDRWQGKVFDEIKADPVYIERRQNLFMAPHAEVETVQEVMLRTKDLLGDLSKRDGCILCASHMDPLKAMVMQIQNLPLEVFFEFEIDHAEPMFFIFENQTWHKER